MANRLIPSLVVVLFSFILHVDAQTINIPDDFQTIQQGIDNANIGDTVLVAPGLYVENLHFNGIDIILASHYLTSEDESFIEQTIIDGGEINSVILLNNQESNATEIVGFTIQNGSNDENDPNPAFGGGIICNNSSPTIRENKIANCHGSVFNDSDFGGIYCLNSNASIENNNIDSISAFFVKKLGGIVAHKSDLTITKNTISNTWGGYCYQGGGISADSSNLEIHGNLIFNGNYDVFPYTASVRIYNSTSNIVNNTLDGEVALNYENTITLVNNIIDSPTEDMAIIEMPESNASISATYNNLEGAWFGIGNDNADPLFLNAENGNYHLGANSPCINTGDPLLFDPDNTRSDKGAFYFDQTPTGISSNLMLQNISIYPNPASDFVQIDLEGIEKANLSIYSAYGRLVKKQHLTEDNNAVSIKALLSGIYYFKLEHKDAIQIQKIIVAK